MIVVRNDILPFDGFKSVTLWPFIFVRNGASFDAIDENHERIHGRQQLEMLVVWFFIWYGVEYLLRFVFGGWNPYRNISFEREAYANDADLDYLKSRRFWVFLKYMKKQ